MPITVYTQRACARAMVTFHALHRAKAAYTAVSTRRKLCLMRHANSGEYLAMPVVYLSPTELWSGFRPDRLGRIPPKTPTQPKGHTPMHTYADLEETREWPENLDHLERIGETRSQLLEYMAAGIQALQRAIATFEQLRSNAIYDVEFVEGRDGRDVAAFLDDSIRHARAAYAVVHTVIDKEAP